MNAAIVRITEQLLLDVLHFPPGTRILLAQVDMTHGYSDVLLKVEHPDLKAVPDGCEIPRANPTFSLHCDHEAKVDKETIVFCGWGQEVYDTASVKITCRKCGQQVLPCDCCAAIPEPLIVEKQP